MGKNVWLALVLIMILPIMCLTVSCAKEATQSQPAPTLQPEAPTAMVRPVGKGGSMQADGLQTGATGREAAAMAFVTENIYFAFDSATLSDQAQEILNGKAEYLRSNSGVAITVEGHCDARGTDAYNMALGERRAESVRGFLVDLGISADRLHTLSYGEERPVAMGQNEASWAKNRRAQFVIN